MEWNQPKIEPLRGLNNYSWPLYYWAHCDAHVVVSNLWRQLSYQPERGFALTALRFSLSLSAAVPSGETVTSSGKVHGLVQWVSMLSRSINPPWLFHD